MDEELRTGDGWKLVEVTGHYDFENQYVMQLRPLDGEQGRTRADAGEVEVVVRLRPSEADAGGDLDAHQLRRVDVEAIGERAPYPVYQAWGELVSQKPGGSSELKLIPAPEADAGPHLSYAIKWFLFSCVGVGGYVFLVRAEARGRRELAEPSAADRDQQADGESLGVWR